MRTAIVILNWNGLGDYVMVHAGFAINIVPTDEATQALAALKEFTDAAIA